MKKTSILLLLLLGIVALQGRVKAVWAPGWDITTPQAIDTMVENCASAGINEILAQVRYRGDALYVPNKHNSRYPNPEPRSHLLKDATFDPLEYLLAKATSGYKRGLRCLLSRLTKPINWRRRIHFSSIPNGFLQIFRVSPWSSQITKVLSSIRE